MSGWDEVREQSSPMAVIALLNIVLTERLDAPILSIDSLGERRGPSRPWIQAGDERCMLLLGAARTLWEGQAVKQEDEFALD